MLFCHKLGGTTYHIDMDLQPDIAYYNIRAPIASVEPEELERVRHYLDQPRTDDRRELLDARWSVVWKRPITADWDDGG